MTMMPGVLGAGIVGHRTTIADLEREVAAPSHAYLFAGPPNVGRATVALAFAAALISTSDDSRRRVMRHSHPDVVVITPEGRSSLGVDQARRAIGAASLRPVESDRKVIIFDDASLMTEAAANALLKTLEEPPAGTVFIAVVGSEDDLPPTVASRCRVVRFGRVSEADIVTALVERGIDEEQATVTARITGGSPGLALDLVANPAVRDFRRRWLEVPGRVTSVPGDGFRLADEMMGAHEPLLAAVKERRQREKQDLESRGYAVPKALLAAHDSALRRTGNALLVAGLEMLASWYLDSVSVQYGGPLRNPDVALTDLARIPIARAVHSAGLVMDAAVQIRRHQRPRLVLAWLFAGLG